MSDVYDKLILQIKNQHKEIYDWFEEKDVNLYELGRYSKEIATALFLAISLIVTPIKQKRITFEIKDVKQMTEIPASKMANLTIDEERAIKVWEDYKPFITGTAVKYDVDPKIIFATIMVESNGNPKAIRYEPQINDASYGLGQILYGTANLIGFRGNPNDLYNPEVNIDLIGRYHKRNLEAYGNLSIDKLATAYNAGNPYSYPTYGYVQKFMTWFNIMGNLLISPPPSNV